MALIIETRPSRTVYGSSVSRWIAAGNPIIFGFYKESYVPDAAYNILVRIYESGTNKLLGIIQAKPFTDGRVRVDVSGVLRGYLSNENPFQYDVVNLTSAKTSIKFYITYEEVIPDPSAIGFSGYTNINNYTRLVGTSSKSTQYVLYDDVYLYFTDGGSAGPFNVIGFESASRDVVVDQPYIDAGTAGTLSKMAPGERSVLVSDLSNTYWAVKASKQIGDLYGQNMGEYVPFQDDSIPSEKKAKFLTEFDVPVLWKGWPFAIDFIYAEGLKNIVVNVESQSQDINGGAIGSPTVIALDATQIETVNRLTLDDDLTADVGFIGVRMLSGDFTQDGYVAPGYVVNGYVEVNGGS